VFPFGVTILAEILNSEAYSIAFVEGDQAVARDFNETTIEGEPLDFLFFL
jgi:hypothetical protein